MRYDIVSDTHGVLTDQLLHALEGADLIVHAGDICSISNYERLCRIATVKACLGNNDHGHDYGPLVRRDVHFFSEGLRWQICHYRERLDLQTCDIAICGHTHRPLVGRDRRTGTLVMNPGSPTSPRAGGPTIGRIMVDDERVISAEIIKLDDGHLKNRLWF